MALGGRISHHPPHFVLRQEGEQIDAIARHAALGREGQHRHAAVARDGRHRRHRGPEQGPDDDFRALAQQLAGGGARLIGGAPSSAVISKMLRLPPSNKASSAAFSMAAARSRVAGVLLEKGRMMPTRTGVLPAGDVGQAQIIGLVAVSADCRPPAAAAAPRRAAAAGGGGVQALRAGYRGHS